MPVLESEQVQDNVYVEQAMSRYGGFDLLKGDNDSKNKYEGSFKPGPSAQYVEHLQTDLKTLGIGIVGNPDGQFGFNTETAVREFQIYAKMEFLVQENTSSTAKNYIDRLSRVANTSRYTGLVHGVADSDTRKLVALWKKNAWRCPVVIQAWNIKNGTRDTLFNDEQNIWKHDDVTSDAPRMYAKDFSGYYTFPGTKNANDYIRLGRLSN